MSVSRTGVSLLPAQPICDSNLLLSPRAPIHGSLRNLDGAITSQRANRDYWKATTESLLTTKTVPLGDTVNARRSFIGLESADFGSETGCRWMALSLKSDV